ncbi:Scr1 family TA system antitoxin-like transcriptional regulator [Streptomyces lavendulocolor]|uniref:Scr1 family TA system antitoxin-like transcriptional regulator n=1 Tax=Streptomyces lavendulocolor TaxID=67316 RepID=UPI003C2CE0BA
MMSFLIEESMLHRPIGDPAVLREQMRHLRHIAEHPHVGLQITPTRRQKHAGLAGPMVLLETPAHEHLASSRGNGSASSWTTPTAAVSSNRIMGSSGHRP